MNEDIGTPSLVFNKEIQHPDNRKPIILRADETIKVIFNSDNKLLIEFINSALGVNHNPDTSKITKLKMEFIDAKTYKKIIADFIIEIDGYSYYIEFQTLPDKTMFIRIFEYGFNVVLEQLKEDVRLGRISHRLDIRWPPPLVIYVEEHSDIPESYNGSFSIRGSKNTPHYFDVPIIKLWEDDLDGLLQRKMYFLLPYLLMRYRNQLRKKTTLEAAKREYKEKYREVLNAITQLKMDGVIKQETYQALAYASAHLAAYLNEKFEGNNDFKEEVLTMLEYGEGLLAQAEAKGEERGEVISLFTIAKFTPEAIAESLNTTIEEVINILKNKGLLQ